jgi:hypothetical protein
MPAYWIKAGLIAIGLAAAIWIVASHSLAYRQTRRISYLTLTLAYLWMAGWMLFFGYWLLDSDGRRPDFANILLLLMLGLSRVGILWSGLDQHAHAHYRHSREILLFRPPAGDENPDPARGLHVPSAPPAPLSPQTQRLIYVLVVIVAVVSILATIVFFMLI